jgi:polyferredoxin
MSDKVIPVKVAVRIRPLNEKEKNEACIECLRCINGGNQVI